MERVWLSHIWTIMIFKAATLVAKQIKTKLAAQFQYSLPGINEDRVALA